MQLREVGKLAMYLWKMWWLQRPGRRALLLAVWGGDGHPVVVVNPIAQEGLPLPAQSRGGGPFSRKAGRAHPCVNKVAHVELLLCRGI